MTKPRFRHSRIMQAVGLALPIMLAGADARAFEISVDNPDVKARWDNTFKYSTAWRLKDASDKLVSDPDNAAIANLDDGDRNFGKGLVSNRLDLFSELDLQYKNLGVRVSGASWYDDVYNHSNDNNSPATANALSAPHNEFTSPTRKLHGRNTELLDAFVFGKFDVAAMPANIRVGRHTLVYGESLFFGSNGIAGGQAPLDAVKLASVPGSQFKEIMRPVEQISGQIQVNSNVSIGAYYQLKWHKTVIPGVGSYLSNADILGSGAERLIAGAPGGPFAGPPAFFRSADVSAKNSGQGGMQLRYRPEGGDVDYGLYAIRYHDKTPQVYLRPLAIPNFATGQIGDLTHVYHEGIKAFGASLSTSVGPANVGAEISIRRNAPLVSGAALDPTGTADNDGNPLYAVGNTAHAQVSTIYVLPPAALWQGGTFLGEIAWNRRTSITKNAATLDPNTTRDAWGLRFIFEPAYFQVLPELDITVPIGLGYNPKGRSSAVAVFNGAYIDKGGDLSIGVNGVYQSVWRLGLNYTKYLGSENAVQITTPPGSPAAPVLSYDQPSKDRSFVSFYVQRTF